MHLIHLNPNAYPQYTLIDPSSVQFQVAWREIEAAYLYNTKRLLSNEMQKMSSFSGSTLGGSVDSLSGWKWRWLWQGADYVSRRQPGIQIWAEKVGRERNWNFEAGNYGLVLLPYAIRSAGLLAVLGLGFWALKRWRQRAQI